MHTTIEQIDFTTLSVMERLELAERLCASARQEMESSPFTPEQLAELDRRVAAADAGELVGEPWPQVYAELRRN